MRTLNIQILKPYTLHPQPSTLATPEYVHTLYPNLEILNPKP